MIKYRARFEEITKHEIVKETAKQVVYKTERGHERREAKETDWYIWKDSFDEAKQALLDRKQEAVDKHTRFLNQAIEQLEKVRGLHEA